MKKLMIVMMCMLPVFVGATMIRPTSLELQNPTLAVTWPKFAKTEHLYGPTITAESLKGKVVFFEYWGINCPPCIASFPHLIKLQNTYGKTGKFTVVGSHSQNNSPKVVEFLKKSKVNFPVYQQLRIPEAPTKGGIPHAVLIDHTGKVIAEGHPNSLYDKVAAAVKAAPTPGTISIIQGVDVKKHKNLVKGLTPKTKNIESKIEPLRSLKDDEEAVAICSAYDSWIDAQKNNVTAMLESDPLSAMDEITKLKGWAPSITEYDEKFSELKENKSLNALRSIAKSISNLENNVSKGKSLKPREVENVMKQLTPYLDDEDGDTKKSAKCLESQLKDLPVEK